MARARGFRSRLLVPLKSEDGTTGFINVTRKEPGAFADKDIELLRTFADQAVIAIQNVKLFEEVQARTRDLQESLQQQTATADVLKVISRSAFDLDTVMNTLASSARDLCASETASLFLRECDVLVCRGNAAVQKEHEEFIRADPIRSTTSRTWGEVSPVPSSTSPISRKTRTLSCVNSSKRWVSRPSSRCP